MGTSKQQAAANRQAILVSADRLFRDRGVDAVSLVDLMEAAGLTRGGFYNHFKSKGALVDEVLGGALSKAEDNLAIALSAATQDGVDPIEERLDWYLSPAHRADIADGCPVSGFAADVRRLEGGAREHFAEAVETYVKQFTDVIPASGGNDERRRGKAVAMVATMVGSLLLSRAVGDVAPALADEILLEGKRAAVGA